MFARAVTFLTPAETRIGGERYNASGAFPAALSDIAQIGGFSDMPLMDPRPQIGKIITANISDDAKRQILGLNACKLLQI